MIRVAMAAMERGELDEFASNPPPKAREVWDCSLGDGSWSRFIHMMKLLPGSIPHNSPVAVARSLEVSHGCAMVTPAFHSALGEWPQFQTLDSGTSGLAVAVKSSRGAMVMSWSSAACVTRFEWMGSRTR